MAVIQLEMWEFTTMLCVMGFGIIMTLLTIFLAKFTPAMEFLKAWWTKRPVALVKNRAGQGVFRTGEEVGSSAMKIKDLGYVMLSEDSQVMERRSKALIFEVFADYAWTIPETFAPIIDELQEMGFEIHTFADYKSIVDIARSSESVKEKRNALQHYVKKKEQDELLTDEFIKGFKLEEIQIRPYKAYKMHQLANMFPNNTSPALIEQLVTSEVNAELQAKKETYRWMITAGVGLIILVVGAFIAYKLFGGGAALPTLNM